MIWNNALCLNYDNRVKSYEMTRSHDYAEHQLSHLMILVSHLLRIIYLKQRR